MTSDDESRLVEVTYPGESGSVTDTYEYNALGQRMRATLDGTVWRYVYNGDRVLQETDDAGVEQARHLTESGSYYDPWVYMKRAGLTYMFLLYDGVGHVRKLTTPGGGGAGSYTYGAFGRYLFGSGSTQNPYKYGGAWGYLTDPSGMLQLGARFYWPEVGRFVSQDPVRSQRPISGSLTVEAPLPRNDDTAQGYTAAASELGGWSPYVYADNRPTFSLDPSGEVCWPAVIVGGAVVVWQGYECIQMARWHRRCFEVARGIKNRLDRAAWADPEHCPVDQDLWQRARAEASTSQECRNFYHYLERCLPAHFL